MLGFVHEKISWSRRGEEKVRIIKTMGINKCVIFYSDKLPLYSEVIKRLSDHTGLTFEGCQGNRIKHPYFRASFSLHFNMDLSVTILWGGPFCIKYLLGVTLTVLKELGGHFKYEYRIPAYAKLKYAQAIQKDDFSE